MQRSIFSSLPGPARKPALLSRALPLAALLILGFGTIRPAGATPSEGDPLHLQEHTPASATERSEEELLARARRSVSRTPTVPAFDAAVVVTQAVGVGPLADRLGNLTVDRIAKGPLRVIGPGEAARLLRGRGGPDPLRCGSDATCLGEIARLLEIRWLITVGIGRFGQMYGLEIGALDRVTGTAPETTSATYASPGPEWEQALDDALQKVLPAELLLPPARLSLRSNVAGAELLVNGVRHGYTPLVSPLLLPEGSYALALRKEGHSVARQEVELRAGEEHAFELFLMPVATAAGSGRSVVPYYAGGASLVSAVIGAFFHASASSEMEAARTLKSEGKPFGAERSDALSRIGTARIFYGVAGAAAIGAITLYLLDGGASSSSFPPEPSADDGVAAVSPPGARSPIEAGPSGRAGAHRSPSGGDAIAALDLVPPQAADAEPIFTNESP